MCTFVLCACVLHALSLWQNHLFCWHRRRSRCHCRHRCRCCSATRFIIFPFFQKKWIGCPFAIYLSLSMQVRKQQNFFCCIFESNQQIFLSRADVTADSFVNFFFFLFLRVPSRGQCVCMLRTCTLKIETSARYSNCMKIIHVNWMNRYVQYITSISIHVSHFDVTTSLLFRRWCFFSYLRSEQMCVYFFQSFSIVAAVEILSSAGCKNDEPTKWHCAYVIFFSLCSIQYTFVRISS